MNFHAYLLRCYDGSYYAGHSDNLEFRMAQHASGALGGYTAQRLPVALVWSESFPRATWLSPPNAGSRAGAGRRRRL
ncbi:hypothetical protein GCM10023208_02840 [Erythrobacter westpacificensis]|uniref:GIY-YIG domain-containing protein n=1 Tax=Erythrobacter westpacificensis TaxID=1055231 RepID=A0ABP9JXH0_9SPHN